MRKIKIKKLPSAQFGGNKITPGYTHDQLNEAQVSVSNTLKPVPMQIANVEAEKGETAYIPDMGGLSAHYTIGGKRHSEGGTPLNLPEDSFIFSDTKKMKLKDPFLLKEFGETKSKTFANIAKKYDINTYRKILADPTADKLQKETAEEMIGNYNLMLGKLALVQESKKGFPNGIPTISQPYMMENNIDPSSVLPNINAGMSGMSMAKYGGVPKAQEGLHGVLLPQYQEEEDTDLGSALLQLYSQSVQQQKPAVSTNNASDSKPAAASKKTAATTTSVQPKTAAKSQSANNNKSKTSNNRKPTYEYAQAYVEPYIAAAKGKKFKPELPGTYFEGADKSLWSRNSLQHSRGNGLYGDPEVENQYQDWVKRHNWYLRDNPDFDPTNAKDVENFQDAYNKKAAEYGLPSYFSGKTQGTGIDGKFGEHTWSAPGFNPIEEEIVAENKAQSPIPTVELEDPNIVQPFGYYPQDTINMMAGALSQIPRVNTFYNPLQFEHMDPAYLTPDLRPIGEASNQTNRGMATFAGRQAGSAGMLKSQGNAMEAGAKHIYDIDNANIGIYNQAEGFNAQISNANAQYNAQQKGMDFDARELYKADRVKARNKKLADMARLYNTRLTNAVNTYDMNLMSPYYKIDPTKGGAAFFANGKKMEPHKSSNYSARYQEYLQLREAGFAHDEAIDVMGTGTKAVSNYEGYPEFHNPYAVNTGPYTE